MKYKLTKVKMDKSKLTESISKRKQTKHKLTKFKMNKTKLTESISKIK